MKMTMRYVMQGLIVVLLLGASCSAVAARSSATAAPSGPAGIQAMIDSAEDGDVLTIPAGIYEEQIVVDKSVRIVAEGEVALIGNGDAPVLHVVADGAAIEGIRIVQVTAGTDAPAVLVSADRAALSALDIRTRASGILLRQANHARLIGNTIRPLPGEGESTANMNRVHNGIDAYDSHDNLIENNSIAYMNDGIYLESSDRNVVRRNKVDHSRYGIHGMFSEGIVVTENDGDANTTGAMIMGVEGAEIVFNTFVKMNESVNSQGILLFEVTHSRIADNRVEGNRVGLYIELSSGNEFRNNRVIRNFVGIQMLESEHNRFEGNDAIGNVIDVEAADSLNNRLTRNYWDAHQGIDTDGDGAGNLRYTINPFFRKLTSETPSYQLFFHSPGMLFLESMFAAEQSDWTFDSEPLMEPSSMRGQEHARVGDGVAFAAAAVMLALSLAILIYYGGRRKC